MDPFIVYEELIMKNSVKNSPLSQTNHVARQRSAQIKISSNLKAGAYSITVTPDNTIKIEYDAASSTAAPIVTPAQTV